MQVSRHHSVPKRNLWNAYLFTVFISQWNNEPLNVSLSIFLKSCLLVYTPFSRVPLNHHYSTLFDFRHHNSLFPWKKKKGNEKSHLNFSFLVSVVVFILVSPLPLPTHSSCPLPHCTQLFGSLWSVFCKTIVTSTNNYCSPTPGHWSLDSVVILVTKYSPHPHGAYIPAVFQDCIDSIIVMTCFILWFMWLISPRLELFTCAFTAADCDVFSLMICLSLMLFLPPSKT